MDNSKYMKLIKDILIFGMGTFGSKFIVFLLLPLYTHSLSKEDFGFIEMINTMTMLAIPVIGLQISDSLYRFLLDCKDDEAEKRKVISGGISIIGVSSVLCIGLYFLFKDSFGFSEFVQHRDTLVILLIFATLSTTLFKQIARGMGKNVAFAVADITLTTLTASGAIYFLLVLKLGINGFLYSMLLANVGAAILLIVWCRLWRYFNPFAASGKYVLQLVKYSVPLIPNIISWWFINASDRYLIANYAGYGEVGLYSVGLKIASIIAMFTTVFNLAWQSSAVTMYHSEEKNRFFSNVFQTYFVLLSIVLTGMIVFVKPVLGIMVAPDFQSSWTYSSVLLVSAFFVGISSFYGISYIVSKNTRGAFTSSVIGAVISVSLNLLLIPQYGAMAAAFANLSAFFVMWLVRIWDSRKYIQINIKLPFFIPNVAIIAAASYLQFLPLSGAVYWSAGAALIIGVVLINAVLLKNVVAMLSRSPKLKKIGQRLGVS